MAHICVGELNIIASDNGLSPGRRQAIIWTNDGILFIEPLGTKFNEILIEIHKFLFMKMHLRMSSAKRRPFCLGPNVLLFGTSSAASSSNIALNREAWQSSDGHWGAPASLAFDGNTNPDYSAGTTTHTDQDDNPYIAVDLTRSYYVSHLLVTNTFSTRK